MILIIRGHIRNSFNTKKLYNLVKEFHNIFPDLKIFIHTWNIFSNNISWRQINVNNEKVSEEIINHYFYDLNHLIEGIIIDDDSKIELIGNLNGKIGNSLTPIIGWKNYWYGKFKIIDHIYNREDIDNDEMVINCRFDLMENSNNFNQESIVDFIKNNKSVHFSKNIFLFNDEAHCGIDNIYVGNVNTMHKLSNVFVNELDEILNKNKNTSHQEFLVYRINSLLFD